MEVERIVAATEPVLGMADQEGAESLSATGTETLSADSGEYRKALAAETVPLPPVDAASTALIIFTSGTSGASKGVCLSQAAIAFNAAVTAKSQEFGSQEVYLSSTPLHHATAGVRVFTMLFGGHTHVVMRAFGPAAWMEAVETYSVTSAMLVPTQVSRVLDDPGYDPSRLSSLRLLVYGAGPSSSAQTLRMTEELPCSLYHGYGLSEACTVVTAFGPEEHRALGGPDDPRLGSCGRPIDGVDVRLRRSDGSPADVGEVGEIQIRSPKVMSGYWQDADSTASAFEDGWLLTGDLAIADSHGFLMLAGRSKEVIISGGVNVYPAQVERAIASDPDIEEVAVFAEPDGAWGESVAAAVKLRQGAEKAVDEIERLVSQQLDSRARPRRVVFVDEFPRTPTGKIRKSLLAGLLN